MVHLQRSLNKKGFSNQAAQAIVLAHRRTTRHLYDLKWDSFLEFAHSRKKNPLEPDVPFLAEFLLFLRRSKNLKGSTISTYLTAVSSVWSKASEVPISKSAELVAIVKSFRLEDQRKKFRPPEWDLNVVLRHLSSDYYEPLDQASLDRLSQKTCFLLALATAARIGEIHALDVTKVAFDVGDRHQLHLGLLMDFVAKNQGLDQDSRTFHLHSLPSDQEVPLLCPVRAVKIYLQRTKPHRRDRKSVG